MTHLLIFLLLVFAGGLLYGEDADHWSTRPASPAVVLADLAAALRPGGGLLLTDLCAHDQGWAREACGDLWLGFAPEELSRWAQEAGLAEGESVYLAQRNGFRIQVRVFHRTH